MDKNNTIDELNQVSQFMINDFNAEIKINKKTQIQPKQKATKIQIVPAKDKAKTARVIVIGVEV